MDTQTIVPLLLVAIGANLVLMAALILVPMFRRRPPQPTPAADLPRADRPLAALAQLAVAGGDIVGGPSTEPGASEIYGGDDPTQEAYGAPWNQHAPASSEAGGEEGPDSEPMDTQESEAGKTRRFAMPVFEDHEDRTARAIESFIEGIALDRDLPPARGGPSMASDRHDELVDEETGLDSLAGWTAVVRDEGHRVARYHRPVTVIVAELDGLSTLADRLGPEAAHRLIGPTADAVRRQARASDRVARTGQARFHILLRETDEVGAINYVERVRAACDKWLEAGAVAVRLSIGWASPPAGGDLDVALRAAEDRMHAERRGWLRPTEHPAG